jgi:histidinol-phosphate aminotransferase
MRTSISRRRFVTGVAFGLGGAALQGDRIGAQVAAGPFRRPAAVVASDDYDAFAKLAFNENPYGPPESVMNAMTAAFKYANRYGYPDGHIVQAIATHHGVTPDNILLGAGSGEILEVVGSTFLQGGRKVIGVEPTFSTVYEHATGLRADAIRLPLLPDHRQDIPAMIHAAKTNYRDLGFLYVCNPNNPTGLVVTKEEIRALLDGIPEDVPVLVDEAYHHFVLDPSYATSVPYVLEGRPVIVTRTFSKIAALAGMRLGYGIASAEIVRRMRPYSMGSINALVKWGGVAALQDVPSQERVRNTTVQLRTRTVADLEALGYPSIRSEGNFFMVDIGRRVEPVIEEFRRRRVLVGRPFAPMLQHLRVSVGTEAEMARFLAAFKEILPPRASTAAHG